VQTLTRDSNGGKMFGFGVAGGGQDQPGNTLFRTLPLMWMNGGGILSEDNQSVLVNSPESVAAIEMYTGFFKDGYAPPSTLENDGLALRRLFAAENIAIIQGSQAEYLLIKGDNPDLDIGVATLPHPEGKQPASILGGWNWIVPAQAPNKAETLKFLAFLSSPENIGFYTNTFPAVQSAFEQERHQNPELRGFRDMLQYARPQPPLANWSQMTQAYFESFQEALLGQPVQEAMDAAASRIQPLIGK